VIGEIECGEDGLVDLLGGPTADVSAAVQENLEQAMTRASWILIPG